MRILLLLFLFVIASGCSTRCERAGIVGNYELRLGENHYELRLADDGSGFLVRDRVEIGSLQWETEPSTEQISLKSDRRVLEVLRELADAPPFPRDVAEWKSGYRGITPRCEADGTAKRLELDVDGEKFFLRSAR